jgi:hypothetical protein
MLRDQLLYGKASFKPRPDLELLIRLAHAGVLKTGAQP